MTKTSGCDAKQNKPVTERQTLQRFMCMKTLKQTDPRQRENGSTRGWEGKEGAMFGETWVRVLHQGCSEDQRFSEHTELAMLYWTARIAKRAYLCAFLPQRKVTLIAAGFLLFLRYNLILRLGLLQTLASSCLRLPSAGMTQLKSSSFLGNSLACVSVALSVLCVILG